MALKRWIPMVSCVVMMSASPARAQDKDVHLTVQNSSKQPFAFSVTTKPSAQGQHFVVKIDPHSQKVRFLGANLSVQDASRVESSQMKGVYSRRIIAECRVERITPEGEDGTAAYGFFVSSRNLEYSGFSVTIASLDSNSVTHYWFFLKDFVASKQSSLLKKQRDKPIKRAG